MGLRRVRPDSVTEQRNNNIWDISPQCEGLTDDKLMSDEIPVTSQSYTKDSEASSPIWKVSAGRPIREVASWKEVLIPSCCHLFSFSDFIWNSSHLSGAETQDGSEQDHSLCVASAWDKPDNGGDEDASNAGPSEGSRSNSKRVRRTDNILKASVWPDLPQTLGFYHLIGSSYKL